MSDAKGLSALIEQLDRDNWPSAVKTLRAFVADYNTLQERLKVCEEEREELKASLRHREEIAERYGQQRDQLTADLEELKLRLKMEAECHEQTVADLERARAEVETLKRVHKHCCKPCGAPDCDPYKTLAQSNERFKAALVAAYDELKNELYFDHPVVVQIKDALKETP